MGSLHEKGTTVMKLHRRILDDLRTWKESTDRKPLLLRGARQTGKTWAVTEFGRTSYENVLRVDFMRDPQAKALFDGPLDPHALIDNLKIYTSQNVAQQDTLIFFDEVQECPKALTALKYFCEEAREYHVIATGSYMGVSKHSNDSFPVGKVNMMTLHPLTFTEFLENTGQEQLSDMIRGGRFDSINAAFEPRLNDLLKTYMFTGGMPSVVATRLAGGDWEQVREEQRSILDSYDLDFSKHAPARIIERIRLAWGAIPSQLAKEHRKFIYGAVRPGARAREFEESLMWLGDYGITSRIPCVSALKTPLAGYTDASAFKLFTVDVGLLGALADISASTILEGTNAFVEFKGSLAEQYVCQQLVSAGYSPYYWANPNGRAEIDFALEHQGLIYPIEVKSSTNVKAKSLRLAHDHFGTGKAIRFSLERFRQEDWVTNIALWGVDGLKAYLDSTRS